MKKLTLILFLSVTFLANAQETIPVDEETGLAKISEVVDAPNSTKAQLFERALAWFGTFYPNPTGVIQSKDPANGEIVGKAQFKITGKDKNGTETYDGQVGYTITLQFKDNKFRYEITRIGWKLASYYDVSKWMDTKDQYYKESYVSYIAQTNAYFEKLQDSLEDAVTTAAPVKKDDW